MFSLMIKPKKKKVVHYVRIPNAKKQNKKNEDKFDHVYGDNRGFQSLPSYVNRLEDGSAKKKLDKMCKHISHRQLLLKEPINPQIYLTFSLVILLKYVFGSIYQALLSVNVGFAYRIILKRIQRAFSELFSDYVSYLLKV